MQRNYVYKRNKKRFKLNLRRIFLLLIFICTFFSGVMLKKVDNIDNKDENITFAIHTVVSGETLWTIANNYDYDNKSSFIKEIKRINKLDNAKIYPGYKLAIPLYEWF